MIIIVLVFFGVCLGSFVNALVYRLHEQATDPGYVKRAKHPIDDYLNNISIFKGRSMCPNCHHKLAAIDLVPLFSYLWLRGKCRNCRKEISWQYPIVELLVAVLFVISYIWWPASFDLAGTFSFVLWLMFLTAFMALSIYDLRWFLLPDRIVFPLVGLAAFEVIVKSTVFNGGPQTVIDAGLGVIAIAGLFYLLYVFSRGAWIGFGDVKLAVVLGLLVGGPEKGLLVIFIASILGSILAIPMLLKGRAKTTTQIPFGPFLIIATMIVVLFGTNLTNFYVSFINIH